MNETIAKIREARQQISEQCGYDTKRLIDYYIERSKRKESQQGGGANSDSAPVVPPSAPSK